MRRSVTQPPASRARASRKRRQAPRCARTACVECRGRQLTAQASRPAEGAAECSSGPGRAPGATARPKRGTGRGLARPRDLALTGWSIAMTQLPLLLQEKGIGVDLVPADAVTDVSRYSGVVLGRRSASGNPGAATLP